MVNAVYKLTVVLFIASMMALISVGIEEYKHAELQNSNLVREAATDFTRLHPQVASVEFWKLDKTDNRYYCVLNSGQFNLCSLTTSYSNDEWSMRTTIRIQTDGISIKSIDNNPEFLKYVELIGEGYHFVKLDTPGGIRITFVSRVPIVSKEMMRFVERWGQYIDKL